MRALLIILLVVMMLAGCHGSEPVLSPPDTPAAMFVGLPSPAELLAADTAARSGKQVSFFTEFEGHQWEPLLAHSDNLTAQPDYHSTIMGGRKTPLTFCVFKVAPDIIPAGVPLESLHVSLSYDGETVTGSDGLYLAYSDFTTGGWHWFDNLQGLSWTFNLAGLGLTGNDGPEYIVAVNYSDHDLYLLELTIKYEGEHPGTNWIYYTQEPEFPGEPRGIARVPVTGVTPPESIRTGFMLSGYRSPIVRYITGGDRLYYTKEEGLSAGIYWCNMDGSGGENDHRTYATSLQLLDWDMAGNIELYIDGYGTETVVAWWYDWSLTGGGSITPTNGYVVDGHIDSFNTATSYAGFLALAQPAPATNSGLYHFSCDVLPWAGAATSRADNSAEQVKGLTYNRYQFASGDYREGCYFVSDARNPYTPADTTENIYFSRVPDGLVRTNMVDPTYDFGGIAFSPDGVWAVLAVKDPADPYYSIYLAPTMSLSSWGDHPPVATDCWGDLEWYYDATP